MALTGYVKIPDIDGESIVAGHQDEIEIFDLEWMIERASAEPLRPTARGRAKIAPLTLSKWYDASSPYLALAVTNGKLFAQVDVSLRRSLGDQDLDFLRMKLTNCRILAVRVSGTGEGPIPAEEVEVSFERIEICYWTAGTGGAVSDGEHMVEIDARSMI